MGIACNVDDTQRFSIDRSLSVCASDLATEPMINAIAATLMEVLSGPPLRK
jgi:hypothetical protein